MTDLGVYIGLGSNLGDRAATLNVARADLDADPEIEVARCSTFYETAPVGGPAGQGPYLNAVAELRTTLPPRELLRRLHAIEARHGRVRSTPNAPRTLDLDLLIYGMCVSAGPDVVVPHPRMWERSFVLEPLAELCDPGLLSELRKKAKRETPSVR